MARLQFYITAFLLVYCVVLTFFLLEKRLSNKSQIKAEDEKTFNWLPDKFYVNFSFVNLNSGIADDKLYAIKPLGPIFPPDATDLDFALSFPKSFPLSSGLSRPIPRYRAGKILEGKKIIIGITSVRREGQDYLIDTLKSLFTHMTYAEQKLIGVVVFLGEEYDQEYVINRTKTLSKQFFIEVEDGFLEIISPSPLYYPQNWMDVLLPSLNDPVDRAKWRSKQNLDQIYLMMYSYHLGADYYLMLEDDVITKKGYAATLLKAPDMNSDKNWFYISFCQLGAIGKMFRMSDIPGYASFLHTFWNLKPLDWLQEDFAKTRVCFADEDENKCSQKLRNIATPYKHSLFQHVGSVSSLPGKLQKLKDAKFT